MEKSFIDFERVFFLGNANRCPGALVKDMKNEII